MGFFFLGGRTAGIPRGGLALGGDERSSAERASGRERRRLRRRARRLRGGGDFDAAVPRRRARARPQHHDLARDRNPRRPPRAASGAHRVRVPSGFFGFGFFFRRRFRRALSGGFRGHGRERSVFRRPLGFGPRDGDVVARGRLGPRAGGPRGPRGRSGPRSVLVPRRRREQRERGAGRGDAGPRDDAMRGGGGEPADRRERPIGGERPLGAVRVVRLGAGDGRGGDESQRHRDGARGGGGGGVRRVQRRVQPRGAGVQVRERARSGRRRN